MLIFYDPTQPPPWPVLQVIDGHEACVYVDREGTLHDYRQPGLHCLELDRATELPLRRYRRWLHHCTVQVVDGQVVLNVPEAVEQRVREQQAARSRGPGEVPAPLPLRVRPGLLSRRVTPDVMPLPEAEGPAAARQED